jgi:hypothetical protein
MNKNGSNQQATIGYQARRGKANHYKEQHRMSHGRHHHAERCRYLHSLSHFQLPYLRSDSQNTAGHRIAVLPRYLVSIEMVLPPKLI